MKKLLLKIITPLISFIHKKIQEYLLKNYKPATHRDLLKDFLAIFRAHGEGFYYSNIWSKNNNFMATIIGVFSYGISHSVPVIYSENLRSLFTKNQWDKITDSWNVFYGNKPGTQIPESVKCLILSSDAIGQVCCDFSRYQNRKISIRKAPLQDQKKAIDKFCEIIGEPYDMWGLPAWVFGIADDPFARYCSEATYDIMDAGGLKIAGVEKPSPGEIELFRDDLIIFKN